MSIFLFFIYLFLFIYFTVPLHSELGSNSKQYHTVRRAVYIIYVHPYRFIRIYINVCIMRERRDAIHIKLFDAVSDTCSPRAVVVVNQIGKGKNARWTEYNNKTSGVYTNNIKRSTPFVDEGQVIFSAAAGWIERRQAECLVGRGVVVDRKRCRNNRCGDGGRIKKQNKTKKKLRIIECVSGSVGSTAEVTGKRRHDDSKAPVVIFVYIGCSA